MVCEDAERENQRHDGLGVDIVGLVGLLRGGLGAATSDGSVVVISQVDGRSLHGIRSLQQRSLLGSVRVVGHEDARLHVGVSLLEEEVT